MLQIYPENQNAFIIWSTGPFFQREANCYNCTVLAENFASGVVGTHKFHGK